MNPASDQKSQLEIAAWELRQKLAGRRGVPIPAKPEPSSKPLASSVSASVATAVHAIDFDVGDDGPQNAVDICLVARNEPVPVPTPANPAPFSGMFSTAFESVESIIESVGGKIADLMRTYGVTETHKEAWYDVIDSAKTEDFVPERVVEALERGSVLNVGIDGFEYFKILKIFDTKFDRLVEVPGALKPVRIQRLICAVDLKTATGHRGRRELLITFPLRSGEWLTFHDPSTQKLLAKRPILSIAMNRKTVAERFVSLFS